MGLGGAQEYYAITPDLATFGKIIGGGFPVGAIAGTDHTMSPLISSGSIRSDHNTKVPITGTFSGNPVTCAAGAATISYLRQHPEIYPRLQGYAQRMRREIGEHAQKIKFPLQFLGVSSWSLLDFQNQEVRYIREVNFHRNASQFEMLRRQMLLHGVILGDVPFLMLSAAHSDDDISRVITALCQSLDELI